MRGQRLRNGVLVAGMVAAALACGALALPAAADEPPSQAVLTAPPTDLPKAVLPLTIDATVTRVIDGSTLDAVVAGVRLAVGYIGATTPPGNTECGRAATARNAALAGATVRLEPDSAYEHDTTGRKLYYAYTTDGDLIDAVLVQEGLARAAGGDGARGAELAAAEAQAQAAGTGCIWSTSPAA